MLCGGSFQTSVFSMMYLTVTSSESDCTCLSNVGVSYIRAAEPAGRESFTPQNTPRPNRIATNRSFATDRAFCMDPSLTRFRRLPNGDLFLIYDLRFMIGESVWPAKS